MQHVRNSSLQAGTPVTETAPSAAEFPMNNFGTDLFDAAQIKWLPVVYRFSGFYRWLSLYRKTTSAHIIETWDCLFTVDYYNQVRPRTHFGLQFDEYCSANSIEHELSLQYNPESNEAAASNIKSIILSCEDSRQHVKLAMAAWREIFRADSPSQLAFGETQKQKLLNPNATEFDQQL